MDISDAEETESLFGLPVVGALGPGASVDSPPSSPRNPLPADLAMEARIRGFSSLEDWHNYLTVEEEKLEQRKRRFEEECRADWAALAESMNRKRQFEEEYRADWAALAESMDRKRRFERHLEERWSKAEEDMAQALLKRRQILKQREEDQARWARIKADAQRRIEDVHRQNRDLDIEEEALNKLLAKQREQLQKRLLVQSDRNKVRGLLIKREGIILGKFGRRN